MKRTLIAKVKLPKGAFGTIKKDGSIGYKKDRVGRRIVVGRIKREDGFIYFLDRHGHVFRQESTFGKKKTSGLAKGKTKRSAKKTAKRSAKKSAKRGTKKTAKRGAKKSAKRGAKRGAR